ncbi:DUF402 domain-containing protein [Nocardioides currus]|uniref:DUF402 domain-containing protein n=1 Tax=Nocardioides currus TaxID=2133958 RepID=A0A2R7YVH9_9ACTN|nr:DUF402 domain-containing protein [Nocardioides currus]PUA80076.1 hypothetical protein C7S10_16135 [Nocardioides currus]
MTQASGDDTAVSESGGSMVRLTGTASPRPVDLSLLESERNVGADWPAAGSPPFLDPGGVLLWRYGRGLESLRVVRDDERGLVAWLAPGSEGIVWLPADGVPLRDRPPVERVRCERVPTVRPWHGGGILRIAPTGRPWSVWLFWEDDGAFAGHYVNLELPHRRRDGELATRDLTLDLWLEPSGELWLKDADEVEGAVTGGHYSVETAGEIHAAAEWARSELVEGRDWPLDEEWTRWSPPSDWTALALPDIDEVRTARATTLPT